jgi:hypothetical protein
VIRQNIFEGLSKTFLQFFSAALEKAFNNPQNYIGAGIIIGLIRVKSLSNKPLGNKEGGSKLQKYNFFQMFSP